MKDELHLKLTQYYGPMLMPFPLAKTPILKSENHLHWIRSQPCIVTGKMGVDAHHVMRKSQGYNDFAVIPLTREIHSAWHSMGVKSFEDNFGIDCKAALIAKLCERIFYLESLVEF